jgi:hypothetical protein
MVAILGGALAAFAIARGDRGVSPAADSVAQGGKTTANGAPSSPSSDVVSRAKEPPHERVLAQTAQREDMAVLRRGLASDDVATRIAAIEAVVSTTAVEALGDLERFELARDPGAAPTVIRAIALLGASAEGERRDDAASTLARWLRDEMKREGPDTSGNVSNIVEALGDIGGEKAIDALGAALDRADLALHVETLAVQKLGELGDTRARAPVERFAKRVAMLPPTDGIDEELRVEAVAAGRTTLSKI